MAETRVGSLGRRTFRKNVTERRRFPPLEEDERMYNLSPGYWVYEELVGDLRRAGWQRFGPGFKAAVYGHPDSAYCIKLLGMGVGENPRYFCERGYYIDHERSMLQRFRDRECSFCPRALDARDAVAFLKEQGVREWQAEMRVERNDLLVMEYIAGVPFAIQTGRGLQYDAIVDAFDCEVLEEMLSALKVLQLEVKHANARHLEHNDPMPPNIIFTLRDGDIRAMLVDFEIAMDHRATPPEYVINTVRELYVERGVPAGGGTNPYKTNLDMHLLGQSIEAMEEIKDIVKSAARTPVLDKINFRLGVHVGSIVINLGEWWRSLRHWTT